MKLPKELKTVTPLSKTLALITFIVFPIIVFFLGMHYQQTIAVTSKQSSAVHPMTARRIPSPTTKACGDTSSQVGNGTIVNAQVYKIVFTRMGDICIINSDGTNLRQLTNYRDNLNPLLSPLGDSVAYYSADEKTGIKGVQLAGEGYTGVNVWSVKIDGTDPVKLTSSDISAIRASLTWSPLGNQLMYIENNKVITVNPDGSDKKVIVDLTAYPDLVTFNSKAIYSLDGSKIIVTADTQADEEYPHQSSVSFTKILLFDLNGHVINSFNNSLSFLSYWSLDNKLYFMDADVGGAYRLEDVNLDGSNETLVAGLPFGEQLRTYDASSSAIYGANESIAISKDGKMIATNKEDWYGDMEKNHSPLWVMNIDGSNSHPVMLPQQVLNQFITTYVPHGALEDVYPGYFIRGIRWAPDNQHLIFMAQKTTNVELLATLYSIKTDGTDFKVLDPVHTVDLRSLILLGDDDDQFSTGVESLYP